MFSLEAAEMVAGCLSEEQGLKGVSLYSSIEGKGEPLYSYRTSRG